jgi:hypothetical protein
MLVNDLSCYQEGPVRSGCCWKSYPVTFPMKYLNKHMLLLLRTLVLVMKRSSHELSPAFVEPILSASAVDILTRKSDIDEESKVVLRRLKELLMHRNDVLETSYNNSYLGGHASTLMPLSSHLVPNSAYTSAAMPSIGMSAARAKAIRIFPELKYYQWRDETFDNSNHDIVAVIDHSVNELNASRAIVGIFFGFALIILAIAIPWTPSLLVLLLHLIPTLIYFAIGRCLWQSSLPHTAVTAAGVLHCQGRRFGLGSKFDVLVPLSISLNVSLTRALQMVKSSFFRIRIYCRLFWLSDEPRMVLLHTCS